MAERFFSLALLSLFLRLLLAAHGYIESCCSLSNIAPPPLMWDTESKLAYGVKLPLSSITRYELAFIPGVSDRVAEELLKTRFSILHHAYSKALLDSPHPFTLARGVGPKTAPHLAAFIALE